MVSMHSHAEIRSCSRNPASSVDAPRAAHREMRAFNLEQTRAFLAAIVAMGTKWQAFWTTFLTTGLRGATKRRRLGYSARQRALADAKGCFDAAPESAADRQSRFVAQMLSTMYAEHRPAANFTRTAPVPSLCAGSPSTVVISNDARGKHTLTFCAGP
jgi:hypothetical protein